MSAHPTRVAADELRRFTRDLFVAKGMPASDAATVADVLVWANLRGVDTHGVSRAPSYLGWIDRRDLNPRPSIRLTTDTPAAAVIEADRAAGPVAMVRAMHEAATRARSIAIGMSFVRATTHTGALGYYARLAAEQGLAGIAMSASSALMAYHGARAAGVSTAPIAIGVPGGGAGTSGAIVFDMSPGLVSMGRLAQARRSGESIPTGWALDRGGNPTTDPATAAIPLPLGGPKGSGLALMVELITSLVVANPLLAESLEGTPQGKLQRMNGLVIAIDIARFTSVEKFRGEVERLIADLKRLPVDAAAGEILMPGERGDRMNAKRVREGIPLSAAMIADLAALASQLGVTPLAQMF